MSVVEIGGVGAAAGVDAFFRPVDDQVLLDRDAISCLEEMRILDKGIVDAGPMPTRVDNPITLFRRAHHGVVARYLVMGKLDGAIVAATQEHFLVGETNFDKELVVGEKVESRPV